MIVVAGATGDLGGRIVQELVRLNAPVVALARGGASAEELAASRADVRIVDFDDERSLTGAVAGATCVISALSGLEPVVIGAQGRLLDAAVRAGVPRFIPSDFAIDFRKLPPGTNRNLDLRKRFQARAEQADIRLTSVFNGAFMDMLTGTMPIVQHPIRRVLYWGSADQPMDFTTIADTAAFTARAAMDDTSPRALNICGGRVSARDLAEIVSKVHGRRYRVMPAGTVGSLGLVIAVAKRVAPGKAGEIYPAWQGMQYMRNLFAGEGMLDAPFDNDRYPGMRWTRVEDVLLQDARR
ncbi:NmrA family NAD(P)-binding protein [Sphingomonas sp. IW22]|uniref:NmrA family NAD(P)-binding protein n=1 Tax=Sphingomonas sp. IW22 TaxID=3242489 RepID=UPI003520E336